MPIVQMGSHHDDLRKIVADTAPEIIHYQSLLQKLLAKRDSAQLELDSIVYPVLTLPPEITAKIFHDCLPTSYTDRERNGSNPQEAPILLSHVCRMWREITIGTPALWTTMDLEICDVESADIFKTWLSRTGALPLSVKLDFELDEDAIGGIFEVFAEHSHKMQSIELEIYIEQLQALEKVGDHCSFPLLQMLSIHFFDADDYDLVDDSEIPCIEIFSNSPLLCEVSLNEAPPSFISLPWHQLSKFTGKLYSIADCLQMLRLMANLAECAFAAHDETQGPTPHELTHSNLRSLTLFEATSDAGDTDGGDSACSITILDYLSLPSLQTLQILDSEATEFDEEVVTGFLSRSSSPLRKCTIRLNDYFDYGVMSLLQMPELVDLEIWDPSPSFLADFFNHIDQWDPSFIPRLQHLAFLGCEDHTMSGLSHKLALMQASVVVRSGWFVQHHAEFAKLESFRLTSDSGFGNWANGALLPFQKLAAKGLDIRIEGKPILDWLQRQEEEEEECRPPLVLSLFS
ncbi:hypothetical protein FB451DRAFT_479969 [Mycena latifolia]|nr:hypothetical protein FB451DRAFT_479969 [Mycena latifolia]